MVIDDRAQVRTFCVAGLLGLFAAMPAAFALEPKMGEAKALEDCDRRLCTMILRREPAGDDLKCELSKTWAKKAIKGADSATLTWGFGDARCSVQLHIARTSIVTALNSPSYKLWVPAHTADCIVEQSGELKTIKATLAPKIEFKGGRVEKIWINLLRMEGSSSVTGLLSAGAALVDSTGLFQGAMIKETNKYIYTECPKNYPEAFASPAPKVKPKKSTRVPAQPQAAAPK